MGSTTGTILITKKGTEVYMGTDVPDHNVYPLWMDMNETPAVLKIWKNDDDGWVAIDAGVSSDLDDLWTTLRTNYYTQDVTDDHIKTTVGESIQSLKGNELQEMVDSINIVTDTANKHSQTIGQIVTSMSVENLIPYPFYTGKVTVDNLKFIPNDNGTLDIQGYKDTDSVTRYYFIDTYTKADKLLVEPGLYYTISWNKPELQAGFNIDFVINFFDSNKSTLVTHRLRSDSTDETSKSFIVPTNAALMRVRIEVPAKFYSEANPANIHIEPMLEWGQFAHHFQPCGMSTSAIMTRQATLEQSLKGFKMDVEESYVPKSSSQVQSTETRYLQTSSPTEVPTDDWENWSTNVPAWVDGKYIWQKDMIIYTDNSFKLTDAVCITGASGKSGTSQYTYVRYCATDNPKEASDVKETPTPTTKYIGIKTVNSPEPPVYTEYTWNKFMGDDGVPGEPGADGQPTYTWIKYAKDSKGTGMSDKPDNAKYIGMAYNKLSQKESDNPEDYTWSKYVGEDGVSDYTYIRYADDSQGTGMTPDPTGKKYIGIAVSNKVTPPTSASDYIWSKYTGDDGANGNGIDSITYYYATTTSSTAPDASKITNPNLPKIDSTNKYLWQKEVIKYTNKTTTTSVLLLAVYGDSGTSSYTFIKYSASASPSSEADMKETPDSTTKYIGVYSGTLASAPTDPTKYKWSKYVGDKGAKGDAGNGINSMVYYYKATSSPKIPDAGDIKDESMPTLSSTNKYLWQKQIIDFTDTTVSDKVIVSLLAVYGDTGDDGKSSYTHIKYSSVASPKTSSEMKDNPTAETKYIGIYNGDKSDAPNTPSSYSWSKYSGDNGKDGNGITSITYSYKTTADNTAPKATSTGWLEQMPPTDAGNNKYLWQKEVIDFTDTTMTDKTSVVLLAVYGDSGNSVKLVTPLYAKGSSNTTAPTTGWSATAPELDSTKKYMWTKTQVTLVDSSGKVIGTNETTPVLDENATWVHTQYDQLSDKFSWIVESGTDKSTMVLTDSLYALVAKNIDITGNTTFRSFQQSILSNSQILVDTNVPSLNKIAHSVDKQIYKSSGDTATYKFNNLSYYGPAVGLTTSLTISRTAVSAGKRCLLRFNEVPLVKGTKYTASVYARIVDTSLAPQVLSSIYVLSDSNSWTSASTSAITITNKEWQKFSWTFTYNYNRTTTSILLGGLEGTYAGEVELCGFKLEKGDIATEWCFSQQDMGSVPENIYTLGTTTINGGKITTGSITADQIQAGAINAEKISAGAITAEKISTGAITADKISVTDLSAIGATIGGWTINSTMLVKYSSDNLRRVLLYSPAKPSNTDIAIAVQKSSDEWASRVALFAVTYDGVITARGGGRIGGWHFGRGDNTDATGYGALYAGTPGSSNGIFLSPVIAANSTNQEGNKFVKFTICGQELNTWMLAVGANFGVTNSGKLYATGVAISGEVTATTGKIGGWTIGSDRIVAVSTDTTTFYRTLLYAPSSIKDTTIAFMVQSSSDSTFPSTNRDNLLTITYGGKLTAKNAEIVGNITASSGQIGAWKIGAIGTGTDYKDSLNTTVRKDSSATISKDNPEYAVFLKAAPAYNNVCIGVKERTSSSTTWADASYNFYVNQSGKLYVKEADITGKITSSSGAIGGWTINSTNLIKYSTTTANVPAYRVFLNSPASPASNSSAIAVQYSATNTWTDSNYENKFYVRYDGYLAAYGGGRIGGWYFGSSGTNGAFYKGTPGADNSFFLAPSSLSTATDASGNKLVTSGISIAGSSASTSWVMGVKNNFGVTSSGTLYANGAHISGTITATNSSFTGTITATNSSFSGSVTASSGTIGGWTLNSSAIYRTSATYGASTGMYFGSNGLSIKDKFKVDSNGYLTATGASLSGTVSATTFSAASDSTGLDCKFTVSGTSGSTKVSGGAILLSGTTSTSPTTAITNGMITIHTNTFTSKPAVGSALQYTATSSSSSSISTVYGVTWVSVSDIKLKKNITSTTIHSALDTINKIKLHAFDWIGDDEHQDIGFIANELELLDTHFVDKGTGVYNDDGYYVPKSIDTFYMLGYVVKAIQELSEENKSLKEQIKNLLNK